MSEPAPGSIDASSIGAGLERLGLPCTGSQPPRTLQELAADREALCAELVPSGQTFALSPKAVWRYAWFEHRETHLIASLLGEPEALKICQQYAGELRVHAARMFAHPNPLSVRIGLFAAVLESSDAFWRDLRNLLCGSGTVPSHGPCAMRKRGCGCSSANYTRSWVWRRTVGRAAAGNSGRSLLNWISGPMLTPLDCASCPAWNRSVWRVMGGWQAFAMPDRS